MPAEAIVKRCPKCKHYFAWDATPWNPEAEKSQNKCTDLDNGAEFEEIKQNTSKENNTEEAETLWAKILKAVGLK